MNTQKQISILCTLFFLLLPTAVSAATVSLKATPVRIGVGDTVRVDILLDSAVPVNAFSGTVSYSKATLEPIAVSDGNSLINIWITRPDISVAASEPVVFAGITPGGFSGNAGMLLSLVFRAKATGVANVSLEDVEVLRNDGAGGKEPVTLRSLALPIVPEPLGGYAEPTDAVPPESFTVSLGNDAELFSGRQYIVFMSADKDSGIDHYTVAESRLPSFLSRLIPLSWRTVTSPYALADQNLTSTLYVKAVDRAGNERLSVYPPRHLFTVYEEVVLLAILIGVVLLWHIRRKGGRGRRPGKNL